MLCYVMLCYVMLCYVVFPMCHKKKKTFSPLNGPFAANGHMAQTHHAGEQATHWDIQNKATSSSQANALFWMYQFVACSPVWWCFVPCDR